MLDIGWTELLLIGIVALIVVGPKDLPRLFHSLGRVMAKVRRMAREFSSAMEDAAKGSGLDEAAGSLREMRNLTSKKALGLDALDRATEKFEKWDPKLPDLGQGARPDPAASAPTTAKGPAAQGAASAAGGEAQSPASHTASSASGSTASGSASSSASASAAGPAAAPRRRLRAVRRSDMKDD